jgi:hypothetical protein
MDEQTELLREAVELLRLIAEPYIASRDEKLRIALFEIVGKSAPRAEAVKLMDGSRTQSDIRREAKIDKGELSRITKSLRESGLVKEGDKPMLAIPIPQHFPKRPEQL